ncbi:hypothetical protein LEP1GSC016_3856 [Leptospira borgpetersenii serovar Hardjo-bovis str. Sponselee]|uniref:Uncharacterized protein n=1 Tax=Leptospira borgpetersenii serovar Hardjo-bovis str. Sponselee TaxID=1303729 RepID=M6BTP5_LEPBO|nr:hypothetical protein LEP1GSC016_3856 [Leptospira borgpetersenii serovar Hardjo-bovis str. Sponselee]
MNTTNLSFFIPSSSIGSAAQTLLGIHTLINFLESFTKARNFLILKPSFQ